METKWLLLGIVIFTIALMNYKMKEEFLDLGGWINISIAVLLILTVPLGIYFGLKQANIDADVAIRAAQNKK